MLIGVCNAAAKFQFALDIILNGVRWQVCRVYMGDVIVFSRNVDDRIRHLDTVLSPLWDAGITLKFCKYFFFQSRVEYFGRVIFPGKLAVSDTYKDAFGSFEFPRSFRELFRSWEPVT